MAIWTLHLVVFVAIIKKKSDYVLKIKTDIVSFILLTANFEVSKIETGNPSGGRRDLLVCPGSCSRARICSCPAVVPYSHTTKKVAHAMQGKYKTLVEK